jgi:hypothetical protein
MERQFLERWAFDYASLCVREATRDLNAAWHAALERRFPPGDVAVEGWKCRMVLHDTNGEPCAMRQPSHAELRDALAAPEWPHSGPNQRVDEHFDEVERREHRP